MSNLSTNPTDKHLGEAREWYAGKNRSDHSAANVIELRARVLAYEDYFEARNKQENQFRREWLRRHADVAGVAIKEVGGELMLVNPCNTTGGRASGLREALKIAVNHHEANSEGFPSPEYAGWLRAVDAITGAILDRVRSLDETSQEKSHAPA